VSLLLRLVVLLHCLRLRAQEAVGLGNRRLQIRQKLSSLGPVLVKPPVFAGRRSKSDSLLDTNDLEME
jgi:hypothetical protein